VVILSNALRMQSQLRLLRYERGLTLDDPPTLPLLEPAVGPMIVTGVASKAMTLDYDRVRMAPRAFGPLPASVPLRLDHDDNTDAGTIESLEYDADGSLLIVARIVDAKALRRPAWSVAAIIDLYDIDQRECSATVRRARLQEISLVTRPADSHALVMSRQPPSPVGEFYSLMAERVKVLTKMAKMIQENVHAHA
jgi:hypothetical protein